MRLNCGYWTNNIQLIINNKMSVNLSVVRHCLMASSTVVASCG